MPFTQSMYGVYGLGEQCEALLYRMILNDTASERINLAAHLIVL